MDHPLLSDPHEFPGDEVLSRHLGKAKLAWDGFMGLLKGDYPQLSAEWRYYNDGKSWLCKVTRKTTTICWVAVWDRYFTVGFYLNAKAEPLVRAGSLDSALKGSFLHATGKLRSIRVEVRARPALKAVRELIEIKLQAK
jgi:hypothetical protein